MRRTGWTVAAAIGMLGTLAQGVTAQTTNTVAVPVTPPAPAPAAMPDTSVKTTQMGVYTEAQAQRGSQTYAGTCGSCHTPSSHTGATYNQNWQGHPLSDLFLYVSTQMPQDNPGSLDPNSAADVVAFLLKTYSMPAGTMELTPDTLAMKKILIDSRAQRPPQ
jgi:mono/diheme cytochrome c family protein